MASDDTGGKRPASPVVLRIKLRYDDVETLVQRFAPNVGKSGLFLPTKSLQPVGAEIKFELRLANEQPVLVGLGRVRVAKPLDPEHPKASFGMAVELTRVTRESRDLMLRMLERRRELGLAEVGIPMPEDIDAARRSDFVDTAVRDLASGPVAVPAQPSGPIEPRPEVLTAPRRPSGPLAVAKVTTVAPLAVEPPRKRRPALGELIEAAGAGLDAAEIELDPELRADIDVAAVIARARVLAGGDLDAELDALREATAAPIEISVEAASAELARQLGGGIVRRDRSGGWAPPPATATASVAPAPVPEVAPEASVPPAASPVPEVAPEASVEAAEAAPEPVVEAAPAPEAEALAEPEPEPSEVEVEPEQIHDEIHQLSESDFEEVEHTHIGGLVIDPAAFDEHAYETRPSSPEEEAALASRLEAHLAEAEAEAEADDLGIAEASASGSWPDARTPLPEYQQDFIHQFAPAADEPAYEAVPVDAADEPDAEPEEPVELRPRSFDGGLGSLVTTAGRGADPLHEEPTRDVSAFAETMDAYGPGSAPAYDDASDEPAAEAQAPLDAAGDEPMDEPVEEVEDFEILAEADADDADLLTANAEAEHTPIVDPMADPTAEPGPDRPSFSDFAARLDLGDDSDVFASRTPVADPGYYDAQAAADDPGFYAPTAVPGADLDLAASAGHALAAFDDEEESYTRDVTPEPAEPPDFAPAPRELPILHPFDQSDVLDVSQVPRRARTPAPTAQPGYEENDLESALQALDVDLDDLSVPQPQGSERRPGRARTIRPPGADLAAAARPRQRTPARPSRAVRATTDDGVLIDFDDDNNSEG